MKMHQDSALPTALTFKNLLWLSPWALGLAMVSAAFSAALSIAPFWFIYLIAVEFFQPALDIGHILFLAFMALVLFLLRWVMMGSSHLAAHWGAFDLIYHLRLGLSRQLGQVPLSIFSRHNSGSLRRTLHDDVGGLEGFYAHMLPDTVAAASVPVCTLALLFFADWRLALAVLVPLPLALLAQWWWMARSMSERMEQWAELQKAIANRVGEYVRCIGVIKSFGLDSHSFSDLEAQVRGAVDWVEDYAKTSTGGFVIFSGLLRGSLVLVAPLGAWLFVQNSLDLPTYILFLLLSPLVLEPLLRLMFAWHEWLHKRQALERINAILLEQPLQQSDSNASRAMLMPSDSTLDIEFNAVSHRYDARRALENVSFLAKAGEVTAIVGESGAGKSTILRLIARLYEEEAGSISLGGRDVCDWPLETLLEKIAVVFQDVFLFSGSVRDNLRLARIHATDEEIEAAARKAQAHDFILSLPQGYDTQLGEEGARLSGGERQRLSIARALLKNAPILLLDEATASLDAENEHLIRQALYELCQNRTVLMISHNLHSTLAADQILLMQEGRLIAQGCHEDLLRDCLPYQSLWHDHIEAQNWQINQNQGEAS